MLASEQMWPCRSSPDWVLPGAGVLLLCPLLCPENGLSCGIRWAGNSILFKPLSGALRPGALTLPGTHQPSCSDLTYSRTSGYRDWASSAGFGATSSDCTMNHRSSCFSGLIDWGGEMEEKAFPCDTRATPTPAHALQQNSLQQREAQPCWPALDPLSPAPVILPQI